MWSPEVAIIKAWTSSFPRHSPSVRHPTPGYVFYCCLSHAIKALWLALLLTGVGDERLRGFPRSFQVAAGGTRCDCLAFPPPSAAVMGYRCSFWSMVFWEKKKGLVRNSCWDYTADCGMHQDMHREEPAAQCCLLSIAFTCFGYLEDASNVLLCLFLPNWAALNVWVFSCRVDHGHAAASAFLKSWVSSSAAAMRVLVVGDPNELTPTFLTAHSEAHMTLSLRDVSLRF